MSARRLEPPSAITDIAGFAAPVVAVNWHPPEEPLMQAKQRAPVPSSPEIPLMQKKKVVADAAVPAARSAPLQSDPESCAIFDAPSVKLFHSKSSVCRQPDTLRHDMQGETAPRYAAHAAAAAAASAHARDAPNGQPAGKPQKDEFIPSKRAGALRQPTSLRGSGLVG